MIKTIDSSSFRANFKDAMDHVKKSKTPLIIKQRNIPTAVLVAIDEYEDYLAIKDKNFLESIKKARGEYGRGDIFNMEDVFADIK